MSSVINDLEQNCMMAEIILNDGTIISACWNGEYFLINGIVVEVDDFTKAVFNYSSHEWVFVDWIFDNFLKVGLDSVSIRGKFRCSEHNDL